MSFFAGLMNSNCAVLIFIPTSLDRNRRARALLTYKMGTNLSSSPLESPQPFPVVSIDGKSSVAAGKC